MSAPNEGNALPVTKTEGFNYWVLLWRVVGIGLLSASLVLIWWSYYRVFAPAARQSREINATLSKLATEVDELDRRWSQADIEELNKKFALVQSKVFASQSNLDSWLADFQEQVTPLGVSIKTDYASTASSVETGTNLLMIPTLISVDFPPGPAGGPSPYQRLLQCAQRLTSTEKSADFTELVVQGGPRSISHAAMSFNFWEGLQESK